MSQKRERRAFFKNLRYWEGRRPDSPLRVELANLKLNIRADEVELASMRTQWYASGGICCPACMFGDALHRVYERLRRRVDRVNQITAKLFFTSGQYGPLPRPFWSMEL